MTNDSKPVVTGTDCSPAKYLVWHDGCPPKYIAKEWFIAQTAFNDRVVLTALPEEWSYDFKTADDTYIKADKIKRWMQFPDSAYIPHEPAHSSPDEKPEWQPIETANKSRPIWLAEAGHMRLGYWRDGKEYECRGSVGGGWIDHALAENGSGPRGLNFAPTHWAPLPDPATILNSLEGE